MNGLQIHGLNPSLKPWACTVSTNIRSNLTNHQMLTKSASINFAANTLKISVLISIHAESFILALNIGTRYSKFTVLSGINWFENLKITKNPKNHKTAKPQKKPIQKASHFPTSHHNLSHTYTCNSKNHPNSYKPHHFRKDSQLPKLHHHKVFPARNSRRWTFRYTRTHSQNNLKN